MRQVTGTNAAKVSCSNESDVPCGEWAFEVAIRRRGEFTPKSRHPWNTTTSL